MATLANNTFESAASVADSGIPRAVIPPLDEFALTPNPEETQRDRDGRMVREVWNEVRECQLVAW